MNKFDPKFNIFRDPNDQPGGGAGDAGAGDGGAGGGAGDQGGQTPEWVKSLPEEAQKDPNITKYKTSDEFYKGYKSTVDLVGRKGVIIPKDDATPEEQGKFFNAIGRPEKPEGYKFEPIKDLDPSIKWDDGIDNGLKNLFHERGLSAKTAAALRADFAGMLNQSAKQQIERETNAMKNAETKLRQDWGADYEANRSLVAKGILTAGGQEAIDAMGGEKGLGNNPVVLKTLAKIFKGMSEDSMKALGAGGSQGGAQSGNETKEEAQKKIDVMNSADKTHPLWNENDPKHAEAVAERARLYKIAHAEGA